MFTLYSVRSGETDEKYIDVTLCLDGTHIPINDRGDHPGGDFYSYKNKDNAYNILVIFLIIS